MQNLSFETIYESIRRCYGKSILERLPSINDVLATEQDSKSDYYCRSIRLRIDAINEIRKARDEGSYLDIKTVWSKISESIRVLPVEATISSIGSQGFFSVPLFKMEGENFEFIRLHIWDKSLDTYINAETRDAFSIHTHAFHANSWILCGQIVNDRFLVKEAKGANNLSLFRIGYNSTLNEVNQHSSVAMREDTFVEPIQISHEIYLPHGNYSIKAGEYHKSGTNEPGDVSATLFSFNRDKSFNGPSHVVGPTGKESSEINRKVLVNPLGLIARIDEKLKSNE
jgi:hypothetical protein